ncbi:nitroreductase [bacterium]|nr:nitroreductase [bacterium]
MENPILQTIRTRRSIKLNHLKPDPVPQEIIDQALEAANWAPSHGETEPWRFTLFTGEARHNLGQLFAEAYELSAIESHPFKPETAEAQRARATQAPVWISIGMTPALHPNGDRKKPRDEEIMAVACAIQNLHLALTTHGICGKWTSGTVAVHPHIAQAIGLTPPSELLGFFYCGYPAIHWPDSIRQPWQNKITTYGQPNPN